MIKGLDKRLKLKMMWAAIIIGIGLIGIGSAIWLGKDNFVEEAAEEIIDDVMEYQLDMPAVHLDLTPSNGETDKA